MKKESFTIPNILSLLTGGGVFLLFLLIRIEFPLAVLAGVVGYFGGFLLFSRKKDPGYSVVFDSVSEETLRRILGEGRKKIAEMKRQQSRIADTSVREKVEGLIDVTARIYADFEQDPEDIKSAKQFLNYYVDATVNIITNYANLAERQVQSDRVRLTMSKAEKLMDTIRDAFEVQLARLLNNEVMDLDVELDLIEKTIKLEGMEGE